jgi:hypothetical protein
MQVVHFIPAFQLLEKLPKRLSAAHQTIELVRARLFTCTPVCMVSTCLASMAWYRVVCR